MYLSNISPEGSDDDHGDDAGEEEDDDDTVDDGEDVDLRVRHVEVDVPPGGPLHVRLLPRHLGKRECTSFVQSFWFVNRFFPRWKPSTKIVENSLESTYVKKK